MRHFRLLVVWLGGWGVCHSGFAQNEGRSLDFGGFLGASFYHGDATSGAFNKPMPTLGLNLRMNRNLRFSWQTSLQYQHWQGTSKNLGHSFPRESSFATHILSLSFGGEYHWYPYGVSYSYLGTRRWTPYIGAGLGLSTAWQEQVLLSPQLYATAGVKYQLKPQLQLILAYTWQYHTSDRLDALDRHSRLDVPFGQSPTALRHGDGSSFISLGLSWKLKYKHINCN